MTLLTCGRVAVLALLPALTALPAAARAQATAPPPQSPQTPAQPPAPTPAPPPAPETPPTYEETVVVSASRTEGKLINAPATMSVITSRAIELAPTQNFAELLRSIPGVNVSQISARDINLTSRGATGTLATGQLALLDGRSLYQDFFGFVMWDFLPVNFNEVKQIEVIRGPASAVWGANAMYGVVNVITKSPREIAGTSAVVGFGGFQRTDDQDAGGLWYANATHAQALNDQWAFKLSAGAYSQGAFSRPTGVVPCDRADVCGNGPRAAYPPFSNSGTTQPKLDVRVDYDMEPGRRLSLSGGVAGTEGIMHSGIGPFDIASGSVLGYAKATYTQGGLRISGFTNLLNGDADNLLTSDANGQPILFDFKTQTYDVEISNLHTFRARHVVSYGGNLRFNNFNLSIAPDADNRVEFGVYGQDEIFLSDQFRWVVGARVDRFDYLDSMVFSPRTTLMFMPFDNQTLRISYNRAYRAPSAINSALDLTIAQPIDLGLFVPQLAGRIYLLPVAAQGNPDLSEHQLDAFEVGYTGLVAPRTTVTAAFYINNMKNEILFTQDPSVLYTPSNPPPGWPLPPFVLGLVPGGGLPARYTYENLGRSVQRGFELGLNAGVTSYLDAFVNYSWQGTPDPKDFPLSELNIPPTNRFNAGLQFYRGRFVGDVNVTYTGDAYWQDVLTDPYHGTTNGFTLVNAGFGLRWAGDRLTTSIKLINLTNDDVQQHVFGDILKRQAMGEIRVNF